MVRPRGFSCAVWSCHRLRVRVVGGCSCLRALHPLLLLLLASSCIVSVCCRHVSSLSLCVLAVSLSCVAVIAMLIIARVRTWLLVVCGRLSSFVGGRLRFLGGCGGSAVIGGRWRSWAITRAVVVKSMVGGGDEHGWWWWEEEMVVVGRK